MTYDTYQRCAKNLKDLLKLDSSPVGVTFLKFLKVVMALLVSALSPILKLGGKCSSL